MKKFRFSLEALDRYKLSIERKQKAELATLNQRLQKLESGRDATQDAMDGCAASQREALRQSTDLVSDLRRHHDYLLFLQGQMADFLQKIERTLAARGLVQQALIVTLNERKTLARLREEAYNRYLEEVRQEEEKVLLDLMSHTATVSDPD